MHDTIPALAQADCLTAFKTLRDGTETTLELGEGCNRFPPSPTLARYLSVLLDRFIRDGTLSAYAGRSQAGARAGRRWPNSSATTWTCSWTRPKSSSPAAAPRPSD
ncbi:hypothetical protein [Streptomyces sp. NPDC048606]|uniref:hypothetical protein n=1 Tax=Streptomyces sp. NPDC048606 TaxID=3154726 RepID=UPI003443A124